MSIPASALLTLQIFLFQVQMGYIIVMIVRNHSSVNGRRNLTLVYQLRII